MITTHLNESIFLLNNRCGGCKGVENGHERIDGMENRELHGAALKGLLSGNDYLRSSFLWL